MIRSGADRNASRKASSVATRVHVQLMPSARNCCTVSSASDTLSSTISNCMFVKCKIPFTRVFTLVPAIPMSP